MIKKVLNSPDSARLQSSAFLFSDVLAPDSARLQSSAFLFSAASALD